MSKILCFIPYNRMEVHIATGCEVLAQAHKEGHEIFLLSCEKSINRCFANWKGEDWQCTACCHGQMGFDSWLSRNRIPYQKLLLGNYINPDAEQTADSQQQLSKTMEAADIRNLCYHDFPVGLAALGSLISQARDTEPDLIKHQDVLGNFIGNGVRVFESVQQIIRQFQIDKVYVFNGRVIEMSACFHAAKSLGTKLCTFDFGMSLTGYATYENSGAHNLHLLGQRILVKLREMETSPISETRIAAAKEWFDRRQRGSLIDGKDFLRWQDPKALPENFDSKRGNISFYIGSVDEWACVPEWNIPFYQTQENAISQIARALCHENLHFYVRVHPYLFGLDNQQLKDINRLRSLPNVTVIDPNSSVSTYALVSASHLNIAFGSTVGVESLYLRKPMLLLAPALYQALPGVLTASNEEQVLSLIRAAADKTLAFNEEILHRSALAYSLFMNESFIPFRHFQLKDDARTVVSLDGGEFGIKPFRQTGLRIFQRLLRNPVRELRKQWLLTKLPKAL